MSNALKIPLQKVSASTEKSCNCGKQYIICLEETNTIMRDITEKSESGRGVEELPFTENEQYGKSLLLTGIPL